jgi:hypothetical protein
MRIPYKLPITLYVFIIPLINTVISKNNTITRKKVKSKNLLALNKKLKNKITEKYKVIYMSCLVFL